MNTETLPDSLHPDALARELRKHLTREEVLKTTEDFDESTPAEIVGIATILRGLRDFAQETADDQIADGFTADEALGRVDNYDAAYSALLTQWR